MKHGRRKLPGRRFPGLGSVRREEGVTAIEFAIILPVYLLIIFGGIGIALLIYNYSVITNAAREAARWQVVIENYQRSGKNFSITNHVCTGSVAAPRDPVDVACNYVSGNLVSLSRSSAASVTVLKGEGITPYVSVTVNFPMWLLPTPFFNMADEATNLSASTVMYYE